MSEKYSTDELVAMLGSFLGASTAPSTVQFFEGNAMREVMRRLRAADKLHDEAKGMVLVETFVEDFPKFTRLLRKAVADFNSLKKTEIINVVLKSGVDLVGKVPAEILK